MSSLGKPDQDLNKSSTEHDTEEPTSKKRDSSSSRRHRKDPRDRSHRNTTEKHRSHRDNDDDSSKNKSSTSSRHHSSSTKSHYHRDERHAKSSSHNSHRDHHKDDNKDSHRHSHHSDRHRNEKSRKKDRSRSVTSSSDSSGESDSNEKQDGQRRDRRRHRSGSRERDGNQRHRNENRLATKPKIAENKRPENGALAGSITAPAVVVVPQEGELNVAAILKSIIIPPELRFKPVEAAKYQMEQLRLKTEELTGVKVPSFYSTTAVNPLVYAEQAKKRKLLWSKAKDNGVTTTSIVGRAIVEGQDEKTSEKFRKLMGIKNTDTDSNTIISAAELQQRQLKINEVMDKEYEMARMSTHTHRGQGLGFASLGLVDPNQPCARPAH